MRAGYLLKCCHPVQTVLNSPRLKSITENTGNGLLLDLKLTCARAVHVHW